MIQEAFALTDGPLILAAVCLGLPWVIFFLAMFAPPKRRPEN